MIDWGGYEPYVPLHEGPPREMPKVMAREQHEHQVAHTAERIGELRLLLERNGLALGDSSAEVQTLNDWYLEKLESHATDTGRLMTTPPWTGISFDIGLFIGDFHVRNLDAQWQFLQTGSKKEMNRFRTVLVDPRGIDWCPTVLVMGYGGRFSRGLEVKLNYFNLLLGRR